MSILKKSTAAIAHAAVRSTAASGSQIYESQRAVDEYLLFHYGKQADMMPFKNVPVDFAMNFTKRSTQLVHQALTANGVNNNRVLDIGCAVGGLSFELSQIFEQVVGLDFSANFIQAANDMKQFGQLPFQILKQGQQFYSSVAEVPNNIDRSKVEFRVGDACNLPSDIGKFDAIIGSNLLCRLPYPKKFLNEVSSFLNPNGLLILISPYSWLEEYTSSDEWIGAKEGGPESFSVLRSCLENGDNPLRLKHREDISFLIREHERKYQLGVSDATIWSRT